MRILLITAGSRGDVEPFVALARRAMDDGHTAQIAAPDNSGADAADLDYRSLGVDYSRMIQDQGVSALAAMRSYRSVVKPAMHAVIVGAAHAAREFRPDVIVYHPKILSAPRIADALGIPHVLAELVPAMTPTRAFPAAGTVTMNLGPLNRATYSAASAAGAMFRTDVDAASAVVGLPRGHRDSPPAATLLPISSAILPRPADWPDTVHLTGPWTALGASSRTDAELDAFTDRGSFLYAGFGSMAMGDPGQRGRAVVGAARARGERALVVTGLGGIAVPDDIRGDDVLVRRSVDHTAVLPRASAAIHHGGIGTVHAAVRSGTVSIVVPFIADQPFWGAQLHRRGLGPAPIRRNRLTAEHLSAALDEIPTYQVRVDAASERMREKDGTRAALRVIESLR
jgi:sterol 3beta-glucosyltransferase